MLAWHHMWPGELATDLCDRIICDALQLPMVDGTIGHGGVTVVDQTFRRSRLRWLPRSWTFIRGEMETYIRAANAATFGFDLSHMPDAQFTEYAADDAGEYKPHTDNSWINKKPYDRKLSVVVQLSNPADYDGCDLTLAEDQPDQARLRTRGTVIVFPSFLKHAVTPCLTGVRYSLVGWMLGPKFR